MRSRQTPLSLRPREDFKFSNFVIGVNGIAIERLRARTNLWIYGLPGIGKTHLLHALSYSHENAVFVSDRTMGVDSLETFEHVAIDDMDEWVGSEEHEVKLQSLYQRMDFTRSRWLLASRKHPLDLQFAVRDLGSRLRSFECVELHGVPEESMGQLIVQCAERRGFTIDSSTVKFLMARIPRTQAALIAILDLLDRESLAQKRKITIPFVRQVCQLD